jgi:polar amino acid transport system substrate-binding protein
MKKWSKMSIVAIIAASAVLAACGAGRGAPADNLLDAINHRGYTMVATDTNYEPASFLNIEGKRPSDTKCPADALTTAEMQGFDVDVAKAIGDALAVETCFATPSFDATAAGSWADRWDVSVNSMTITTERENVIDFSVPYYYTPAVVAVRADLGLTSLEDLSGQAVCAGAATTYQKWLSGQDLGPTITTVIEAPPDITVVTLETDQECAQGIAAGREDFVGYIMAEPLVDANLAEDFPVVKLGDPVFYEKLAAAFDKASTLPTDSLRAEVDKLFTKMHSDGTLTELSKKWFKDANGDPVDYTIESK